MNYYSFHIGDYAVRTRYLSPMTDLAYRRLLDVYYTTEQPIPLDAEKVAESIGLADHVQDVSKVLSDYFVKSEAGYRNKRADEEIALYQAKAARAKKANESRWKSNPLLISEAKLEQVSDVISDAFLVPTKNQEPITNKNTSAVARPDGVPDSVWQDFLKIRRAKKAPMTDTALTGIRLEADRAGMGLGDVLAMCCTRGWQGFKADWVDRAGGSGLVPGAI